MKIVARMQFFRKELIDKSGYIEKLEFDSK